MTDEEAYCGRTSMKNPHKIFEAGVIRDGNNDTPQKFSLTQANEVNVVSFLDTGSDLKCRNSLNGKKFHRLVHRFNI